MQQQLSVVLIALQPAVPFEEDERDPNIWFLDHSYLEGMSAMFKKVNGMLCTTRQLISSVEKHKEHFACCCSKGTDTRLLQYWS